MRQDFFQFDATHKFVIAANHRPQLRSVDHAIRRRLLLVPFNVRFEGARRDPHMLAKLRAESPAILAWLVEGAAEWYRDGLQIPERVREASDEYAHAMDSMGLWLEECCLLTGNRDDVEPAGVLYRSYAAWKERRGESPLSQMQWGEQMSSRAERHRSDGIKYRGIRLTPEERVRVPTSRGSRA
jgi:putative DNA primase/helicase